MLITRLQNGQFRLRPVSTRRVSQATENVARTNARTGCGDPCSPTSIMAADVDRTRRWSQTQRHTPGPVPKAPEHVHGLRDVYTHPFYLTSIPIPSTLHASCFRARVPKTSKSIGRRKSTNMHQTASFPESILLLFCLLSELRLSTDSED